MFDAGGRVVLLKQRFAQMKGVPAESLQGISLLELIKLRRLTGADHGHIEATPKVYRIAPWLADRLVTDLPDHLLTMILDLGVQAFWASGRDLWYEQRESN
jgi:hypothetical protein